MTDFKKFMDDCTHLFSGMTSLGNNIRTETEQNLRTTFQTMIKEAGFIHKDEFETLAQRFELAAEHIKKLEKDIEDFKNHSNAAALSESQQS